MNRHYKYHWDYNKLIKPNFRSNSAWRTDKQTKISHFIYTDTTSSHGSVTEALDFHPAKLDSSSTGGVRKGIWLNLVLCTIKIPLHTWT